MDDNAATLAEIYDAIGDVERWRRVTERLARESRHSADLERHLAIARIAHERHVTLAAGIETLAAVQDQLALGAFVVDEDRRVLRANTAGNRLLADAAGLAVVHDRIEATDPEADVHLGSEIQRAARGRPRRPLASPFTVVPRKGRQPLAILVVSTASPVLDAFGNQQAVALLAIDPEMATVPAPDALRQIFGLTPREAEFVAVMGRGASVKDAARALGVTVATARTFLARVAEKTDSRSQAELVRQLRAIPRLAVPNTDIELRDETAP